MSDEDRVVAAEAGWRGRRGDRGATARRTGCGSSRTTRRPTTGTTTSSRTRCCGSSSTTSGASRGSRTSTTGSTTPGRRATWPSTSSFADAVLEELEREPGRGRLLPRLPPLRGARARARARAGRDARATSSTSRGRSRTTGACCRSAIRRAVHEGMLANDVVSFHTERWARNFLRCCEDIAGAESDFSAGEVALRRAAPSPSRPRPISVDPAEFDELAASERVREEEAKLEADAPGVPDRPRRPDRSVEEHRPRLPRLRAVPRGASRAARARRDARAPRPVAPGHPGVLRVPGRDPARRARGQRPLPQRRLAAARPPDRGQLPAGRRGVQAVRRAARERDLRRHEPRREGGARS